MIRIWRVTGWKDANCVTYYEPHDTAMTRLRELLHDGYDNCNCEAFEVPATQKGIAHAMQRIIDEHCLNEH